MSSFDAISRQGGTVSGTELSFLRTHGIMTNIQQLTAPNIVIQASVTRNHFISVLRNCLFCKLDKSISPVCQ